ncbi:peptidoglycan DD-metalloendopeptidase family protein [Dactylosporangium sp. CS-033363]|uniref:peptidoglycan DD-metalloendopeptidase family protein n=1 Tax=Dactylosporangium sp. CS-033363 TaxID=3239935 RepID=UPI003D8A3501
MVPLRGNHLIGCSYLSPDGNPANAICRGNYHLNWAIDIGATVGETVYAAGKGTVFQVVRNQGDNCNPKTHDSYTSCPDGAKGNFVLIDHGGGVFSFYEHLQSVAVDKGKDVDENTPIGAAGVSGYTTPSFPHLHFERRPSASGKSVDPGPLKACKGAKLVTYPQEFGAASWQGLPGHKFTATSDGTACAGAPGGGTGKPKVDLVFAIDTTGSMGPYIGGVSASARSITAGLFSKADARVALVDYKDLHACASDGYAARVDLPFATDPAAFDTAVGKLTAEGGCDTPESIYSGLMAAIGLPWRDGVKKAIILMGDAPPHDPEPVTGLTLAKVTAAAKAVDPATIYAININGAASPFFDDLAAQNDGQVYVAEDPSTAVDQITDAITSITTVIADAGGPYRGAVGEPVTFDASASGATGASIAQYQWDFNGDNTYDETTALPSVSHVFTAPYSGVVGVRITTDGAKPQTATASAPLEILVPTTLKYSGDRTGVVGKQLSLRATLTDPGGAAIAGAPVTFTLGTQSCSGTTNAAGLAECKLVPSQAAGDYSVAADARPTGHYLPSSTAEDLTLTGAGGTPAPTPTSAGPAPSTTATTVAPTPASTTPGPGGPLAVTGVALGGMVLAGSGLVGAGALLLLLARRRRHRGRHA